VTENALVKSRIKKRIDQIMLAAMFGYGFNNGTAEWVALVKHPDKDMAYSARGESPLEAGEKLERVLADRIEKGEIGA